MESDSSFSTGEQNLSGKMQGKFLLRLFVAGFSARSQTMIDVLCRICETRLRGSYRLEVVDIYQQPELARRNQILATPTLVKYLPEPKKIMIGDLSRTERVLACLSLSAD